MTIEDEMTIIIVIEVGGMTETDDGETTEIEDAKIGIVEAAEGGTKTEGGHVRGRDRPDGGDTTTREGRRDAGQGIGRLDETTETRSGGE